MRTSPCNLSFNFAEMPRPSTSETFPDKNYYDLLLSDLTEAEIPKSLVEVRTIDDSPSHEADIVIVDWVRTGKKGFIDNPNRMCVALSRARVGTIMTGPGSKVDLGWPLSHIVEYCQDRNATIDLKDRCFWDLVCPYCCQPGHMAKDCTFQPKCDRCDGAPHATRNCPRSNEDAISDSATEPITANDALGFAPKIDLKSLCPTAAPRKGRLFGASDEDAEGRSGLRKDESAKSDAEDAPGFEETETSPLSYSIIPTSSGGNLECGLYALINSIAAQLPSEVPPTIDELRCVLSCPEMLERMSGSRVTDTRNFTMDHQAGLLKTWGEQRGQLLQLGVVVEGSADLSGILFPEDGHTSIWIHNDNSEDSGATHGHYSGLSVPASDSSAELESMLVSTTNPPCEEWPQDDQQPMTSFDNADSGWGTAPGFAFAGDNTEAEEESKAPGT
ncbi:hypothetical protein ACHAO9_000566 [Fusarium lateritium]